ncbi:MAG: hypothetical protein QNL43_05080 [Crocinitomicaceae bacterium]
MKFLFSIFFLTPFWCASLTQIMGKTVGSEGEWIHIYEIDEFATRNETALQKFKITSDNQFYFEINNKVIKKYVIRLSNVYTELFLQPNSAYNIFIPQETIDVIPYFSGKETELLFLDLDSIDINYKILGFEAWMDDEMASLYLLKDADPSKFIDGVLKFKMAILKEYKNDSSIYFKNHIKYVLGKTIDNINYFGGPNASEKFSFYIKNQDVLYDLPSYMDYFRDYYNGIRQKLSPSSKRVINLALFEADGRMLIKGLLIDSIVPSQKIAEIVALQIIEEEYPKGNISQNNLIGITLYLQRNSKHEKNTLIAKNLARKFYTIVSGDPLPTIQINEDTYLGTPSQYQYLHFFDPSNPQSLAQSKAMKLLHEKYGETISFVSIYLNSESGAFQERIINSMKWPCYGLDYYHPIWKSLNVNTFPYYILVNENLIIESIPALGPIPNGTYETIAKRFFDIQKTKKGN